MTVIRKIEMPKKSLTPTAVATAIVIHTTSRRWFSFVRQGVKVAARFQRQQEEWPGTEVGSQDEEIPVFDLVNGMMLALRTIPI